MKPNYFLNDNGTFVIENYNSAPSFSSFFPGIAGTDGIPMWSFYVNRAQGVAGFGVKNKNYPIMEFYPANTSYSVVSSFGFRTFLKIKKGGKTTNYEAFKVNAPKNVKQTMFITSSDMAIEEVNESLGIKVTVNYATLPHEPLSALIRTVTVENISKSEMKIEIADGMSKVMPYYMNQFSQKYMSTTIQAWAVVDNFEKTGTPFYRLKVEVEDRPEVVEITKGNFYFGYLKSDKSFKKTQVVIDPDVLFGADLSFEVPQNFYAEKFAYPKTQFADNKYPCAFSLAQVNLKAGKSVTLYSLAGHIESTEALNKYVKRAGSEKYFITKLAENADVVDDILEDIATNSADKRFDAYTKQAYLDNVMRGGKPVIFKHAGKSTGYYVYSRKHGDLERDYNDFQLSPGYYSQGNGNFRDVNQNRRKDIFFNPELSDSAVKIFYNLIQIDANNPLVVKGAYYVVDVKAKYYKEISGDLANKADVKKLDRFFAKGFEPGQLAMFLEAQKIKLKTSVDAFIGKAVILGETVNDAEHGEGFWVDHWTYNLDLLESYLAIYPEKEADLVFKDKTFTYFDCNHYVTSRDYKQVIIDGKIRRYTSVIKSDEKTALIKSRKVNPNVLRTNNGKGGVYKTSLASKFVTMIAVKAATLDPSGIGIEMESDKPGWYDSLNGLPGIFGSSVCETFELKRFAEYFKGVLAKNKGEIVSVPQEVYDFVKGLNALLKTSPAAFNYWDKSASLKEAYRSKVVMGISGAEKQISATELTEFLTFVIKKLNAGISKAVDVKTGLYNTYYQYEAVKYKPNGKKSAKGLPCVSVESFKGTPLTLFLEGEVHYLKTEKDKSKVEKHLALMKKSPLYDTVLKMYKVNTNLAKESVEVGRSRIFARGWLENESIWMHMEYKYLLELLRAGLYDEFFKEFKACAPCYQNPAVYGRNILENSSFISSSAFPDKRNHGRGFVARLSGSTAEFIEMWAFMTMGQKPFALNNGKLCFELKPAIQGSLFDKNGEFSFKMFSHTNVKYINPNRKSTYAAGMKVKKIEVVWENKQKQVFEGGIISGADALKIRNKQALSLAVHY
ncbi:MAG: cellobiose phosphorylase [Elusimicrobia bacterium]|nr:cellobiose phosphorylase [Elusimicrobiota bacterium]